MLTTFSYIQHDSFVHRLDPRTKLIVLFAYSFAMLQTSNVWIVAAGFVLALLYFRASKLTWEETKSTWRLVLPLMLLLPVINYILAQGDVLQGLDPIAHIHVIFSVPFLGFLSHAPYFGTTSLVFSVESIVFFFTQLMRNISIATLAIIIPYTVDPGQIGVAFKGLGFPDTYAYAINLSFRFLPTIIRDFDTTMAAQRARGFELDKLRGGVVGKVARMTPLILPVVIGSILGAEDIINAMELRCFGVDKRSWLVELHMRRDDYWLTWACVLGFVALTVLNIIGIFYTQGPLHVIHIQGIPDFLYK